SVVFILAGLVSESIEKKGGD
ncbi:DUF1056 family protein, partial [Mycobacterium kansasii]